MANSRINNNGSRKSVSCQPSEARAALVVAHPGHELMVYGWLEAARPRMFVLTDGSGHSSQPRLSSTTKILEQAGAPRGEIYGRLTDAAAYAAILHHQFDLFTGLAKELSATFMNERIDFVAGDALEGYNPMHDICRLVINAAVNLARHAHGHPIANFEFSLVNVTDRRQPARQASDIWLQLDETVLAHKISVARGYAELAGEVSSALETTTVAAFGVERLCLLEPGADSRHGFERPAFYEKYGERQVAAGHYTQVIRYDKHIAPLADALKKLGCEKSQTGVAAL